MIKLSLVFDTNFSQWDIGVKTEADEVLEGAVERASVGWVWL